MTGVSRAGESESSADHPLSPSVVQAVADVLGATDTGYRGFSTEIRRQCTSRCSRRCRTGPTASLATMMHIGHRPVDQQE